MNRPRKKRARLLEYFQRELRIRRGEKELEGGVVTSIKVIAGEILKNMRVEVSPEIDIEVQQGATPVEYILKTKVYVPVPRDSIYLTLQVEDADDPA